MKQNMEIKIHFVGVFQSRIEEIESNLLSLGTQPAGRTRPDVHRWHIWVRNKNEN
jgi:hypothetical protein